MNVFKRIAHLNLLSAIHFTPFLNVLPGLPKVILEGLSTEVYYFHIAYVLGNPTIVIDLMINNLISSSSLSCDRSIASSKLL
jgi:hypothetical protein